MWKACVLPESSRYDAAAAVPASVRLSAHSQLESRRRQQQESASFHSSPHPPPPPPPPSSPQPGLKRNFTIPNELTGFISRREKVDNQSFLTI